MYRSSLVLLLISFYLVQPTTAQTSVQVVDLDSNTVSWSAALGSEAIFLEQEQVFQGLLYQWLEHLQQKYKQLQLYLERSYISPEQEQKLANALRAEQEAIAAAEIYFTDTIAIYKETFSSFIQERIVDKAARLHQKDRYGSIVFQQAILYQEKDYPVEAVEMSLETEDHEYLQNKLAAIELEMIIAYTRYYGLMEDLARNNLGGVISPDLKE